MDSVATIIRDQGFKFNKGFGQNFITDTNLLTAIVKDSGVTSTDTVLEIGAGAGTLTCAIAASAKNVISFEIDKNLIPILGRTLAGLDDKVEVIFKDIMRISDDELLSIVGEEFRLIANLPYYITTPIIMRFLEGTARPKSITIMVQKEVAERLVAKPGTSDYGAITVVVNLAGNARIDRIVTKELFYPMPKVDSAVVTIDLVDNKFDADIVAVKKVVKASFAMRRKTLSNNLLKMGFSREVADKAISDIGLDSRVRGEELSTEKFIELQKVLKG